MSGPCTAWVTLAEALADPTATNPDGTPLDADLLREMIDVSCEILWAHTAREFDGVCTDTVRPLRRLYEMSDLWGAVGFSDYLGPGWRLQWGIHSCGRPPERAGGCGALSEITLGRDPVREILSVRIDGQVIDPASYRIDDDRWLVWIDQTGPIEGWPCFPAGTSVLTDTGLRPIEEIQAGERVLTHRNRWRTVTRAGKTGDSETVLLRGRGGTLRCTPDHRLWAAEVAGVPGRRKLGSPAWTEASGMLGSAWATPRSVETVGIPYVGERRDWSAFWWFVGRWVGDGWTEKGNNRVVLCAAKTEAADVRSRLAALDLEWREIEERTVVKFRASDRLLRDWLRAHFGIGAAAKRLPAWLLGADHSIREKFLDGYVSADGWRGGGNGHAPFISCRTVSRDLAIGVRLLASSLGYAPMLYDRAQTTTEIEGRTVRGQHTYRVDWPETTVEETLRLGQAWADSEHLWGRVRSVTLDEEIVPVYDLEVEDDHSFIADGFVVHNCCQRLDLDPLQDLDTFEVQFVWGQLPPQVGITAARRYAIELAKAQSGHPCNLPERLQTLGVQGAQFTLLDPMDFVDKGRTGLYIADQFIRAYNPYGVARRAMILSPDIPRPVRRTGTTLDS